ncbi:MAG: TMEM43 family protein [Pseudomonadota bacterium]|nr:TMEM43 family protein [Pseudomonadota bacterium]
MDLHKGISVRRVVLNVLGALLMLAGVGWVAMTARSLLNYRSVEAQHGGEVVNLGNDAQPRAGQHGYMARVVGTPRVVESPNDPEFNITVDTPALIRHVEMFQWREIRIGSSVHYELDWVDHSVDASGFEHPDGHANPVNFPLRGKRFTASLVQLGGFKLAPELVRALPGSRVVAPRAAALPENLAATFSQYHDYLVTSGNPADPRLGDVRVSWEEVPLQLMTIVARVDGSRLVAANDAEDGKGYEVQVGDVSLLNIFPDLPVPPNLILVQSILAVLLAALGAFSLLSAQRNRRRDGLLALALGALVVGTVASVLWTAGNSGIVWGWLGVALAGMGIAVWRLRRRSFHGDNH